jgi:hypothetical protein
LQGFRQGPRHSVGLPPNAGPGGCRCGALAAWPARRLNRDAPDKAKALLAAPADKQPEGPRRPIRSAVAEFAFNAAQHRMVALATRLGMAL